MKSLEKIFGLLAIVSLILKFFMVSYSGMIFIVSMTSLTLLYYPLGFVFFNDIDLRKTFKIEAYKGKSTIRIIGTIGLGLSLSILCNGILFKLNGYPLSNTTLIIGVLFTSIALLIVVYLFLKTKSNFYKEILNRIAIIGGIGLALLFISDLSIAEIQLRNNPEALKTYKKQINNQDKQKTQNKQDTYFK